MLPTPDTAVQASPIPSAHLSVVRNRDAFWIFLPALFALTLWMYAGSLSSLVQQWWEDANYSHGFFVPVFALYVLWRERERWQSIPLRPNNYGFGIMLSAICLMLAGTLGAEAFTTRISLLLLIVGLIVFLAGWEIFRRICFPIGYLIFMIPLPALIYYQLTFPMQLWASRMGAGGLVGLGIPTVREGNLLYLPNCTLEVVDACSGVRSLLSILAATVAYSYFAEPVMWKRIVLAVSAIPIVILSNGARLVATGVLSFHYGPEVDSGAIHFLLGVSCFTLAVLSVVLVHKALNYSRRDKALA